jgi:hypothetical protein
MLDRRAIREENKLDLGRGYSRDGLSVQGTFVMKELEDDKVARVEVKKIGLKLNNFCKADRPAKVHTVVWREIGKSPPCPCPLALPDPIDPKVQRFGCKFWERRGSKWIVAF